MPVDAHVWSTPQGLEDERLGSTPQALEDERLGSTPQALEEERLRVQSEINSYPAPIPACDVYFNDLLERRSRICEQLSRLRSLGRRT